MVGWYTTLVSSVSFSQQPKKKRKYAGVLVTKPFVNLVTAIGKDGILESHQNLQHHKDCADEFDTLAESRKS